MKHLSYPELTAISGGAPACRIAEAPVVAGLIIGSVMGTAYAVSTDGNMLKALAGAIIGPFIVSFIDHYFYPHCPQFSAQFR